VETAKSPADTRGCEAPLACGPLPGLAEVFCEGTGKAELGMGGNDEPGPAIGGGRLAAVRPGSLLRLGRVRRIL
jgi:hypothetical protein